MNRRVFLLAPVAFRLRGFADDATVFLRSLAYALTSGKPDAFMGYFDPKMAGYRDLRSNVVKLLDAGSVQSTIALVKQTTDAAETALEFDWTLEIDAADSAAGFTTRTGRVTCGIVIHDDNWRVARFDVPPGFFAPPRGREAWDLISRAAQALTIAPNTVFLETFDHSMPGYEHLRRDATALVLQSRLENSIELRRNAGDDRLRTLELDWIMTQTDWQNDARSTRRQISVTCKIAQQGKNWRIVSFEPLSLFTP